MKNKYVTCLGAALLASGASAAYSTTLLQYPTAGSTTSLSPAIVDPSISGDDLTAGSGLTVQDFSTFNFSGWDPASTSFADAVAANDFWTWGFDVTGNVNIDLSTMDIRLDRSGSGPDDFDIQATVNGGVAVSILSYDFGDSSSGVDFMGVDLSGIGSLGPGDSLMFTLAAYNSESDLGTFDLETVDFGGSDPRALRIEGTVSAVPLPAAAWLFGSALLGMAAISRRRV